MSIYKEKNGTWRVLYRYTDWNGERKQTSKRGFPIKREAVAWEHAQAQKLTSDLSMTFESFYECYETDMKARLKENSWITKDAIVQSKIMPYFAKRHINEITTKDVLRWQNEMLRFRMQMENHIHLCISKRCTINCRHYSIMQ